MTGVTRCLNLWRWIGVWNVAWAVATLALPIRQLPTKGLRSVSVCGSRQPWATRRSAGSRNRSWSHRKNPTLPHSRSRQPMRATTGAIAAGADELTFSIVPASTNPSNKLTESLLEEAGATLPSGIAATEVRLLEAGNGGRISLTVPSDNASGDLSVFAEWSRWLSPYGVRSVRLVLCECECERRVEVESASDADPTTFEEIIWETLEKNLPPTLPWNIYRAFGNTNMTTPAPTPKSEPHSPAFEVSCRRWTSFGGLSKSGFSSTRFKARLRRLLTETYADSDSEGFCGCCGEFTLLLYGETNRLRLEWTLLMPPPSATVTGNDFLPRPGCKRVEAWMLMKNLEDVVLRKIVAEKHTKQPVVVLDPLCGKATFLVEAATTWNLPRDGNAGVSFVGVDASESQLEDAARNVASVARHLAAISNDNDNTSTTIELQCGDSRALPHLPDGSVAAIATCPPFGRQFLALGTDAAASAPEAVDRALEDSYHDWLREWTRLLDPRDGRIALLVDLDHAAVALSAIRATNRLVVTVLREPFRLGRLRATVIVADVDVDADADVDVDAASGGDSSSEPPSGGAPPKRFPWEGTARESRAEWARLRTASLRELVPCSRGR